MPRTTTTKHQRLASLLALLLALSLVLPAVALAADANFNGEGATKVWQYDNVNLTAYGYDLFGASTKDLVPGDVKSINVSLRNNAPDPVDFRLIARSLSTKEASYLEAVYPDKTADDALLDVIDLIVRHGAQILYAGTLRGASASELYSTAGVAIGRVAAGWQGTITVELSLRGSAANYFINKLCAIEWMFTAAQYNDEEPPTPPTTPPSTPETPTTTTAAAGTTTPAAISVDDTPLSELPDADPPLAEGTPDVVIEAQPTPQTQSEAKGAAWALLNLILTVLSAALMLALMLRFLLSRGRRAETSQVNTETQVQRWSLESRASELPYEKATNAHTRAKGMFWLLGIVAIAASVVLFILTEDMRLPMQWVDVYTLWHVVIVLIEVVLLFVPRSRRDRYAQAA